MFYERPSMKMMIDGMFIKKDLTYNDFKALFGFDIKLGVPYKIMQAVTLKYVDTIIENNISKFPFTSDCQRGDCTNNGYVLTSLEVIDYNNCVICVTYKNYKYELRFNYRTDNYPAIEVSVADISKAKYAIYHIRELVPGTDKQYTSKGCLSDETISFLAIHVSNYLIDLLWSSYKILNNIS